MLIVFFQEDFDLVNGERDGPENWNGNVAVDGEQREERVAACHDGHRELEIERLRRSLGGCTVTEQGLCTVTVQ